MHKNVPHPKLLLQVPQNDAYDRRQSFYAWVKVDAFHKIKMEVIQARICVFTGRQCLLSDLSPAMSPVVKDDLIQVKTNEQKFHYAKVTVGSVEVQSKPDVLDNKQEMYLMHPNQDTR